MRVAVAALMLQSILATDPSYGWGLFSPGVTTRLVDGQILVGSSTLTIDAGSDHTSAAGDSLSPEECLAIEERLRFALGPPLEEHAGTSIMEVIWLRQTTALHLFRTRESCLMELREVNQTSARDQRQ